MATSEHDLFGVVANSVLTVTPPGATKPVHLVSPSVGTWIELVTTLQELAGKTPDVATVVKAVAACMADENGKHIDDGTLRAKLAKSSPTIVMWLYKKCWDTVLKVDVNQMQEMEKN